MTYIDIELKCYKEHHEKTVAVLHQIRAEGCQRMRDLANQILCSEAPYALAAKAIAESER